MTESQEQDQYDLASKLGALKQMLLFSPRMTVVILLLGLVSAALEGLGLSFILPIIEIIQSDTAQPASSGGYIELFYTAFEVVGLPFTFEYVLIALAAVLAVRFLSSFLVGWLRGRLWAQYEAYLKREAFRGALQAQTEYFDIQGSDEVLNHIVTESQYGARMVFQSLRLFESGLLSLTYLLIAFVLAPELTVATITVMAGITYLVRFYINPADVVGGELAEANEEIQRIVQSGTQGIKEVKLFNMQQELRSEFGEQIGRFVRAKTGLRRNKAAVTNLYRFFSAVAIFVLIYAALTFTSLSLGSLGLFLFAMFRLSPKISNMNHVFYKAEGNLPHLIRVQEFTEELGNYREPTGEGTPAPEEVTEVAFDSVQFAYETGDPVIRGISFELRKGEFAALVGQSGAGKSTIIDLLTRMYEPDGGRILADGTDIREFDTGGWRSRLAVLQQDPHIFNESLRYNITIGNRDVSEAEIRRVCEVAQVTEFLDELPDGYDTVLGDRGVRLSGGQRQRVALARALLRDADVLVLDEATSDLDTNIEQDVQEAIDEMDEDYAIIAIAHRLSTVRNADRIYTVEDGQFTDVGTHEELLEAGGKYAELYDSQLATTAE